VALVTEPLYHQVGVAYIDDGKYDCLRSQMDPTS